MFDVAVNIHDIVIVTLCCSFAHMSISFPSGTGDITYSRGPLAFVSRPAKMPTLEQACYLIRIISLRIASFLGASPARRASSSNRDRRRKLGQCDPTCGRTQVYMH